MSTCGSLLPSTAPIPSSASKLLDKQKAVKKEAKEMAAALHLLTKKTIEELTDEQAIDLLRLKWIEPLYAAISYIPYEVVAGLVKSVELLSQKYAVTYKDIGALLEVIQTETEVEMQPLNKEAMDEVEQQIIELQERVLDLHKQKRAMKISDAYYNAQVNDYSQQLGALESRKQALQTADARYATVRMWLADFRQHMQEGDATDDRDGSIMKTLVEAIIVWDDRIEVRFKCGATVEQKYVA